MIPAIETITCKAIIQYTYVYGKIVCNTCNDVAQPNIVKWQYIRIAQPQCIITGGVRVYMKRFGKMCTHSILLIQNLVGKVYKFWMNDRRIVTVLLRITVALI